MALATLSLNLDRYLLETSLPLLQDGEVEAIEWSFDALNQLPDIPDWFSALLTTYAGAGRLIGHGVYYSVCNAAWTQVQADWLEQLSGWHRRYPLDHVTEHFGFMTGRDFHRGAPVSPPLSTATLRVGRDRLKRLQHACGRPVGLENLALAYRERDVREQGAFIDRLLEPVNGFILLDAHNLYCQSHNFGVPARELCQAYPLGRVREVHLSGGSWEEVAGAPDGRVRRDTHDARVPEEVFEIAQFLVEHCPNIKYLTLEQLSPALRTRQSQDGFREDFARLRNLTAGASTPKNTFEPPVHELPNEAYVDANLAREQRQFSDLLENAGSVTELRKALGDSPLANSSWGVEQWEDFMLATVWDIARKWR